MTDEPTNETDPTPLTRKDLQNMTPVAILTAYENGELTHLTVESNTAKHGLTAQQAETIATTFDNQ